MKKVLATIAPPELEEDYPDFKDDLDKDNSEIVAGSAAVDSSSPSLAWIGIIRRQWESQ
jgi:hypothetical protein